MHPDAIDARESHAATPNRPMDQFAAAIRESAGDPDFMTSLARGLLVIRSLSGRKRPATVSQLSADTGLSRAVVRRCLHTLTALGCVARDQHHYQAIADGLGRAAWRRLDQ